MLLATLLDIADSFFAFEFLEFITKLMSQLSDKVSMAKVNSTAIEGKLKSKDDLYELLAGHCKCH